MAKATSKPKKAKAKPQGEPEKETETEDYKPGSLNADEKELKFLASRSGRVCKTPGCKTILRLSNPGQYCSPCIEGKSKGSKVYVPQIQTEEA